MNHLMDTGLVLDATYPAQPACVAQIRHDVAYLATVFGAEDGALPQITLAVTEAATNAVVHAYRESAVAGDLRVLVGRANGFLDVSISDSGIGMSPRSDSPGMGLGLGLMAHESHSCEIRSAPAGGTEVVLRFRLAACAATA